MLPASNGPSTVAIMVVDRGDQTKVDDQLVSPRDSIVQGGVRDVPLPAARETGTTMGQNSNFFWFRRRIFRGDGEIGERRKTVQRTHIVSIFGSYMYSMCRCI